jgi:nucleolar protein 58
MHTLGDAIRSSFCEQFLVALFQGIPCLCDEPVMEMMRGMKFLLPYLVREEKSKLGEEDCLRMSQGLQILLHRYGFDDVKPEIMRSPHCLFICVILTASYFIAHW